MSLRAIIKYLKAIKRKFFFRKKIVRQKVMGQDVYVINGTIGKTPDYDDAWFVNLAFHSNIIFDIGANIGYTAVLANLTRKPSRILLVDPNAEALAWAAENLLLNRMIDNCLFCSRLVIDSNEGKTQFFTTGISASGSIFRNHSETAKVLNHHIHVDNTTVDSLVKEYGLLPDLIKVDVEGAEYKVLQGSRNLAARKSCRFLVEMHAPADLPMRENAKLVLNWVNEVGYKAWYLKEAQQLINEEMIASRGRCHLLLQPDDWSYPDFLVGILQKAPIPERLS